MEGLQPLVTQAQGYVALLWLPWVPALKGIYTNPTQITIKTNKIKFEKKPSSCKVINPMLCQPRNVTIRKISYVT